MLLSINNTLNAKNVFNQHFMARSAGKFTQPSHNFILKLKSTIVLHCSRTFHLVVVVASMKIIFNEKGFNSKVYWQILNPF